MKKKTEKKKNKNPGGRPHVVTAKKEETLIQLMSDGMSQVKAASYVGIDEKTIINHKKRHPKFVERLEKAKEETTRLAHKSIKVGMLKDWRAGAWWLERTEPERFKEKKEIDYGDKPILIDDIMG